MKIETLRGQLSKTGSACALLVLTSCSSAGLLGCESGSTLSKQELINRAAAVLVDERTHRDVGIAEYKTWSDLLEDNPGCCAVSTNSDRVDFPNLSEPSVSVFYRKRLKSGGYGFYEADVRFGPCPDNHESSEHPVSNEYAAKVMASRR